MNNNGTPLLEMKGVEKHFGGVRAIDHLDLRIMRRGIYGLSGSCRVIFMD